MALKGALSIDGSVPDHCIAAKKVSASRLRMNSDHASLIGVCINFKRDKSDIAAHRVLGI